MFNKILIALSVLMLAQAASASALTGSQLSTAMSAAGLITTCDTTASGGYSVLVTGLLQGTDLSPNQAFAIAVISMSMLMENEGNPSATTMIGVCCTDNTIRYYELTYERATIIAQEMRGDEAGAMTLALVFAFNSLPSMSQ